jgi:hypothetical protein
MRTHKIIQPSFVGTSLVGQGDGEREGDDIDEDKESRDGGTGYRLDRDNDSCSRPQRRRTMPIRYDDTNYIMYRLCAHLRLEEE